MGLLAGVDLPEGGGPARGDGSAVDAPLSGEFRRRQGDFGYNFFNSETCVHTRFGRMALL